MKLYTDFLNKLGGDDLYLSTLMKKEVYVLALMLLTVPLAGELSLSFQ